MLDVTQNASAFCSDFSRFGAVGSSSVVLQVPGPLQAG